MDQGKRARAARPTMRDVARAAGVSAMTVSRVIRGDAHVAPETRARIESIIATISYRPDERARSLRPGRSTGLCGLVVPNLAIRFYAMLALSLEEALSFRDLSLVIGNTGFDVGRERQLIERLLARRVDGVLIAPAGIEQAHVLAGTLDTPFVFVNHPPCGVQADCVLDDDFGGARLATLDLIRQGHERIAFAGFADRTYNNAERLRGFRAALAEHGLPVPERYLLQDIHDATTTETAMHAILTAPDPPTAVFSALSNMTVGVARAMYSVGQPLALAQFGDFYLADLLGCPLTVAVNNRPKMAETAVQFLLERIDGSDVAPRTVYVPTRLERREPVRPASSRPPADIRDDRATQDPEIAAVWC